MKKFKPVNSLRIIWLSGLMLVTISAAVFLASDMVAAGPPVKDKINNAPLFSFGMIADIQYADRDDRKSKAFRKSLENLKECVRELNTHKDLAFTIQLGDLIEGGSNKAETSAELRTVLNVYNQLSMPKYHVIGNHCLLLGKKTLQQKLDMIKPYYTFTLPKPKGWRFIVLDSYDGGSEGMYGIISKKQFEWLNVMLKESKKQNQRVIIFSHVPPLLQKVQASNSKTYVPMVKLLPQLPGVVAWFSGHLHIGGYMPTQNIHLVTEKGMIENPDKSTYAIIKVYPDRIEEIGYGNEPSRTLKFRKSQLEKL